jgi:hypothetical protein
MAGAQRQQHSHHKKYRHYPFHAYTSLPQIFQDYIIADKPQNTSLAAAFPLIFLDSFSVK